MPKDIEVVATHAAGHLDRISFCGGVGATLRYDDLLHRGIVDFDYLDAMGDYVALGVLGFGSVESNRRTCGGYYGHQQDEQ